MVSICGDIRFSEEGHCGALTLAVYAHHSPGDTTLLPLLVFLLEQGADTDIVSSYSESALSVASDSGRFDAVQFLLDHGADPTPLQWTNLLRAVALGTVEEVRTLLQQGASLEDRDDWERTPWLLSLQAADQRKAELLLAAGVDRNDVGRCGKTPLQYAVEMDNPVLLAWLLSEGFDANAVDEFGRTPLLTAAEYGYADCVIVLLNAGADPGNAYRARALFDENKPYERHPQPVWCYDRFGRTTTWLPDGRIIEIAGEHEDHYDPDFCIYNDVAVFDGKGDFEILSYPERVFPPTDFHTATLVGNSLYIIGCLGYPKQRKSAETPVYRLDCRTFQIELIRTYGEKPGWISEHTAQYEAATHRIGITGGRVVGRNTAPNSQAYTLDLKTRQWTRLSIPKSPLR